jgi:hypothetical protein
MPIITKYLFVASMDVDPEKEALFNEVYDTEHIPNLLKVPGVHAVTRIKGEPFAVSIGGAGPAKSGPTPAIGGTCSIRSASDWPALCTRATGRREGRASCSI